MLRYKKSIPKGMLFCLLLYLLFCLLFCLYNYLIVVIKIEYLIGAITFCLYCYYCCKLLTFCLFAVDLFFNCLLLLFFCLLFCLYNYLIVVIKIVWLIVIV